MLRTCPRCGPKEETEFNWRNREKGTRQSVCRECQRQASGAHYQANQEVYKTRAIDQKKAVKAQFWGWLSTQKCVDCGEDDPVVLDCDHVRGVKRPGGVTEMLRSACSWALIQEELAKCEIRCANCHRRKTARLAGWTRKCLQVRPWWPGGFQVHWTEFDSRRLCCGVEQSGSSQGS